MSKYLFLTLYYGIAQYLPDSYKGRVGKLSNMFRIWCVRHLFAKCGKITTINRRAYFGSGKKIEIGDFSGIGANCFLPSDIKIGKYVMMGPDVYIVENNHRYKNRSIPMCFQGMTEKKTTIIEDDVWIGARVIMTAGRMVKRGSIIGIGAVLTKDFPEYSVVGGNPAQLIKTR